MMDKVSYVVFNGKKWLRGIHWAKLIGKAGQKFSIEIDGDYYMPLSKVNSILGSQGKELLDQCNIKKSPYPLKTVANGRNMKQMACALGITKDQLIRCLHKIFMTKRTDGVETLFPSYKNKGYVEYKVNKCKCEMIWTPSGAVVVHDMIVANKRMLHDILR